MSSVQVVFVLAVLVASCVSLCDPHCRERTQELAFDGVCVGIIIAMLRLLHMMQRPKHATSTLFDWWCLSRALFGVEMEYGLVGGYLLGITRAVIACLV